jgi:tRNA dimethylallyltransferase
LEQRLANGLIEEVQGLLDQGITSDALHWMGLEYKWTLNYLQGSLVRDRYEQGLEVAIHQFAKRQMTFFRKMEKGGIQITWIPDVLDFQAKCDFVQNNL